MLLYGDFRNIPSSIECKIFNFNSLTEQFPNARLLPPNSLGAINEYDFDLKYMNYIFQNDPVFINFMTIIMELFYGNNVYLITASIEDDWSNLAIDSLMKLIQQRYGINGVKVMSEEDVIFANDDYFEPSFGISNLDMDKNRYLYLYESIRIANGGTVQYE